MKNSRRISYALALHGKEERDAVLDVLDRSETIMGHRVKAFEQKVSRLFGKKHGVMVNSGSSANLIASEIIRLPAGSEFITPIMTFATTVAPFIQRGLVPAFTDVAHGSYLINIEQIERLVSKKTRALVIPSLLGNVPDYPRLKRIAKKHNLILIEDSCDTLGAAINGKPTGIYTDISTTSFYGAHIITTAGNGGMLCVNDDAWARDARILRGWGRSSAIDESEDIVRRFSYKLEGKPYDAKFIFERLGYNLLPSELGAAFGLAQLKKLKKFTAIRQKNFAALKKFFIGCQDFFILPEEDKKVKTAWMQFPLTIKKEAPFSRLDLTRFLEEHNVQTRPVFSGNLLRHPGFTGVAAKKLPQGYPVADYMMHQSFLIACHHGLTKEDLDYVRELFSTFLKQY